MPRQRKPIYLRLAVIKRSNKIGELITMEAKTVKDYEGVEKTLTADPDKVSWGPVTESFTITVSTKDKDTDEVTTHYKSEAEPFEWNKVDNIADVIKAHGGKVSEDAVAFLGEALPGEANGKAIASIIAMHNSVERANAKNNQYQKVVNKFKPQSEEDKAKAFERMAEIFSKQAGVTLEIAKSTLKASMAQKDSQAA